MTEKATRAMGVAISMRTPNWMIARLLPWSVPVMIPERVRRSGGTPRNDL